MKNRRICFIFCPCFALFYFVKHYLNSFFKISDLLYFRGGRGRGEGIPPQVVHDIVPYLFQKHESGVGAVKIRGDEVFLLFTDLPNLDYLIVRMQFLAVLCMLYYFSKIWFSIDTNIILFTFSCKWPAFCMWKPREWAWNLGNTIPIGCSEKA